MHVTSGGATCCWEVGRKNGRLGLRAALLPAGCAGLLCRACSAGKRRSEVCARARVLRMLSLTGLDLQQTHLGP
jgi:hypothetical protein